MSLTLLNEEGCWSKSHLANNYKIERKYSVTITQRASSNELCHQETALRQQIQFTMGILNQALTKHCHFLVPGNFN